MARKSHPHKEIEKSLKFAEQHGWRVEISSGGHAWGRMFCPANSKDCRGGTFCSTSIWSTPKNPENHAKKIRQAVNNCVDEQQEE